MTALYLNTHLCVTLYATAGLVGATYTYAKITAISNLIIKAAESISKFSLDRERNLKVQTAEKIITKFKFS